HAYVVHIAGRDRMTEAQAAAEQLTSDDRDRYLLFPYLDADEMAAALAAADLVVCRSGASTIGELPAVGCPAVLVPLPQRTVHQYENARFLADRGAAVILPDDRLDELAALVTQLLLDRDLLQTMRASMSRLAHPDAARKIAAIIAEAA
ncbi:MAG TPA: glycosyltransferase, partial [Chloroflexota bacterium]|nr:glycosyltransferase [Chloroflexota bacterium]